MPTKKPRGRALTRVQKAANRRIARRRVRIEHATNKKAGEFYTPRSVVRLMVNVLDPREGESIYDPACGTGGMLLEAVYHVKENHGDDRTLWGKLFAQ